MDEGTTRTGPGRRQLLLSGAGVLGAALLAAGCGRPAAGAPAPTSTPVPPRAPGGAPAPVPGPGVPAGDVVGALAAFVGDLHGETASARQNWTVSGLSLVTALGMLRAGAAGRTGQEIDAVLHLPSGAPHRALEVATARLVTDRPLDRRPAGAAGPPPGRPGSDGPRPEVAVANALFVDGSIGPRLRPDFLGVLRRRYGAPPRTVDFSGPSAVAAVNDWVAEQTRGRIERLFEQLGADTRLVLANAVYLKAVWTHQFPPELTRPELFSAPAGPVRAALMHLEGVQLPYDDGDGWQRVDLPYRGGELVLRLVLPRRPAASAEELRRLLPLLAGPRGGVARVDLALPRWDARTTLALVEPLARLGLVQAFGPGADFSAMSSVGLHVSDVRHVADVTVDERGTEAAAATGVAMAVSGTDRTATVRADRPFVWALVHTPTGVPVFTGHVVDPTLGRA